MDDRRFDSLARGLASGRDRRTVLKGLLGLSGLTITGAVALNDVQAARRGSSVPETQTPVPTSVPTQPPPPSETPIPATETPACAGKICIDGCCDGQCTATGACCPAGSMVCGADCCPVGAATCCDSACCYGVCYGEELCCPETSICGLACCGPEERCCGPASGQPVCIPASGCCSDDDCGAGHCLGHQCVAESPTASPTNTPGATSTPIQAGTVSLLLTSDCLAQASLTDFTPGTTLPAVRLFGKISAGDDPVQLDEFSNVPITFTGTLTITFAVDLGGLTYTEVQAEVDTGTTVIRTSWIAVTCIRPTVTPTPTPLEDPQVEVSFGADCALQVTLTGFGAGTEVRISVVGHSDNPFPIDIPVLFVPSATIGSDGVLILPPLRWDPEALDIVEVQARVTFVRNQFDSDWTTVDCASPAPTMTPSSTATPSITPTPTVTPTPSATRTPGIPWATVGPTSDCRVQVELTDFPPNAALPYVAIWGSGDFGWEYQLAVFRDQIQTDRNGHAVVTTWFRIGKQVRRVRATVSSGDIDLDTGWTVWGCEPGRRR